MPFPRTAIVLGGTSIVGRHLCERLSTAGFVGECVSRRARPESWAPPEGLRWRQLDINRPGDWAAPSGATVFSLLPIWLLPQSLPRLAAARHLVVLSSTSRFSKAASADEHEIEIARRIAAAEAAVSAALTGTGCAWTILRPTLIYDPGRDGNVSAIASFITRFGFFPVLRPARGLRQPIHADDVALALCAAADEAGARDRAFDLPGGETLPYRDMVRRVFEGLNRRPAIVPLPATVLRLGLALGRPLLGHRYSPALFARMNQDLAFEGGEARRVLGVEPRPFHPVFPARPGG